IWDANYARIDRPAAGVRASDLRRDLEPSLARVGATSFHVVSFFPAETAPLLSELSSAGHRLSWDVAMEWSGRPSTVSPEAVVEEIDPDPSFRARLLRSFSLFDVREPAALAQLARLERDVLGPDVKRWFAVRVDG